MKKIIKIAILFTILAVTTTLVAKEQATYTITGEKDPRLDAWYSASYVSHSSTDECTSKNSFTGGKRYSIGGRTIKVEDANYTIEFPIKLTGENNDCDYRFRSLKLVMKRKYDKELSSIHYVLSDRKKVSPIYWKTKRGAAFHGTPETPPSLDTDKEYFRIAKESTFLCKTFWFEEYTNRMGKYREAHSQFHCTMQINNDVNRTKYIKKDPRIWVFTHPEFGVERIENTTMKIDILVDEKNCKTMKNRKKVLDKFRELKEPTVWQKLF